MVQGMKDCKNGVSNLEQEIDKTFDEVYEALQKLKELLLRKKTESLISQLDEFLGDDT